MFQIKKFFYNESIQDLDFDYIKKTKGCLIIRNPHKYKDVDLLFLGKRCSNFRIPLFIANDLKILFKLKLNNFYISSYNKRSYKHLSLINKHINIIGSAHNKREIKEKVNQGCNEIILSRIFETEKPGFLNVVKFNSIANSFKKIIALGGIRNTNYKKIKMTKCVGIAVKSAFVEKQKFLI